MHMTVDAVYMYYDTTVTNLLSFSFGTSSTEVALVLLGGVQCVVVRWSEFAETGEKIPE